MSEEPDDVKNASSAEDISASVFDFVNDFLDDQASGILRDLAEYQRRFPGAETEIAEEYERLSQPEEQDSSEPDGERFVQHYRLIRELGRGGQGSVWLAEDQNLRRPVALKLLNSWLIAGERLARFQREAESIAKLEHEGLAVVYEAQMESDPPFIAMRFVEGDDLSSGLSQRESGPVPFLPIKAPQDLRAALHFFERAARALHVAHEAGVVHRDIKPGNILISPEGHPVITDFGLARDEFSPGEETITQEGEVFGTPAYMSPEQVGGRAGDVDRRTDIWSLGATLHETLCGRAPFQGKGQLGLARAIMEAPLATPQACPEETPLPTDVRVVLQTALERDLARRYPSALAMAEDLRRIREFEPIQARPAGPLLRLRRWGRREPAWATALGLLLITLIGGLIVSLFTIDRIQGLLHDKEVALDQEKALRYVRQVPALLKDSPSTALAAGLEAVEMHDSWITRSSLYGPLENLTLHAEGRLAAKSNVAWSGQFLEKDEWAILTSGSGGIALVDSSDGNTITRRILEGLEEGTAPDVRVAIEVPGHQAVVIGTSDGRIMRLALPSLESEWERSITSSKILSLELLRGDEHLVALSEDHGVDKLNVKDGATVLNIPVPAQSAALMLALPDGKHILTSGDSNHRSTASPTLRATLWNTDTGTPVREFLHQSAIHCAALSPQGTHLATGTLSGHVYVWDLVNVESEATVRQANGSLDCIAFSPDGESIAMGGDNGAWIGKRRGSALIELLGHRAKVVDLAFSPAGDEIATCAWDTVVRVFAPSGGKAIRENRAGYRPLLVTWSTRHQRMLSAGIDNRFSFWNPGPPLGARRLQGLDSPITWTAFTHDGMGALALDDSGKLILYHTPRKSPEGQVPSAPTLLAQHDAGKVYAAIATRAPLAVSGGALGEVLLHDLESKSVQAVHRGWVQGIRHLAIRPDGKQVAIVDGIGRLGLWNGKDASALRPPGVKQQVQRACFDASGRLLAAGDALGQVLIWDTQTGELLHELAAEWSRDSIRRHPIIDLAFNPEATSIHAAAAPWWALSWDLSNPEAPAQRENRISLRWLRALPDELGVVTCGTGVGSFSIGKSEHLSRPATLHGAPLTCMDVNASAGLAATGCQDGSVLVWDVMSGATLARFDRHGGAVRHLTFSHIDGDPRVLSASEDGTLALWPVDPTDLAREYAPHELTDRNRARFDSFGLAAESN